MGQLLRQHRVFLSYARDDTARADAFERELSALGLATWIDRKRVRGGEVWSEGLRLSIATCDVMVALISPEALASAFIRREYLYALSINKPVLPVLFTHVRSLPTELATLQRVDYTRDTGPCHLAYLLHTAGLISERLNTGELNPPVVLALGQHRAAPSDWQITDAPALSYLGLTLASTIATLVCLALAIIFGAAGFTPSLAPRVMAALTALLAFWPAVAQLSAHISALPTVVEQALAIVAFLAATMFGMATRFNWNIFRGVHMRDILVLTPECAVQYRQRKLFPRSGRGASGKLRWIAFGQTSRLQRRRTFAGGQLIAARHWDTASSGTPHSIRLSRRYAAPGALAAAVIAAFVAFAARQPTEPSPTSDSAMTWAQRGPQTPEPALQASRQTAPR